jgi:hypothetical protein
MGDILCKEFLSAPSGSVKKKATTSAWANFTGVWAIYCVKATLIFFFRTFFSCRQLQLWAVAYNLLDLLVTLAGYFYSSNFSASQSTSEAVNQRVSKSHFHTAD